MKRKMVLTAMLFAVLAIVMIQGPTMAYASPSNRLNCVFAIPNALIGGPPADAVWAFLATTSFLSTHKGVTTMRCFGSILSSLRRMVLSLPRSLSPMITLP